ncbi:response regulator transcription factor [Solimicrobium silvestre]|uniref:Response regulator receiver domain n=1 Tax=Solimicrobium silvestre TaxID=2099400 RepID=A0A2S9H2Y1_9BURK|nr:response regulator [Solimicrobium silvestre]PRC94293.1 Response regulator receiver domain [Solimicrobium silvestre]
MLKILLIEDSLILRERLGTLINAIPNAVLVAQADNEDHARTCLQQVQPDIAIIDLRLKRGSGLTLIEHINFMYSDITTIVLTNFVQREYQARCMALGAHYFFDKTKGSEACINLLTALCKHSCDVVPIAEMHRGIES